VGAVRAPELRATWARLEAWLDDVCATLAEDVATGSVRRSISVPVYPLAEWMVFNWWSITADGRRSARSAQRRNIRSAGDGFLWPDLEIIPTGMDALVRWNRLRSLRDDPLRYMSYGERWVDRVSLEETLTDVVVAVVNRLREAGIEDTPLEKEWIALQALDAEEVEFCHAAARLGLDPFSEGVDIATSIDAVFQALEPRLRDEFLDAAWPDQILATLDWVRGAFTDAERAVANGIDGFSLSLVSSAVRDLQAPDLGAPPWWVGYEAARLLRDRLGLAPSEPVQAAPVHVSVREASASGLTGAGRTFSPDHTNLVIARHLNRPSERFTAGRALWHAADTLPSGSYLITSSGAATQQVGRAFAAELLAPAAGIRQLLGDQALAAPPEDVASVAEHFGASEWVIALQVKNQLQDDRDVFR
jgi:hypothetical protein